MQAELDRMVAAFESGRLTRRDLVAGLAAVAAGWAVAPGALGRGAADGSTFQATSVDHVALRVTDIPASRDFYRQHLGLQVTSESQSSCFLRCGPDFLALFRSGEAGLHHFSFTVPGYEPSRAVEALRAAGLSPRREENRVYFPDPDGLTVQVSAGRAP